MPDTMTVTTPTDREIVLTREFDAPRTLVWDAMHKPEHIQRWLLGPPGWKMTACELDPRVGGTFRALWSDSEGKTMTVSGVYHEFVPPERRVRSEVFNTGDGTPLGENLSTLVLTDAENKTQMTMTYLYDSKEARDKNAALGSSKGREASYLSLDEYLRTMDRA